MGGILALCVSAEAQRDPYTQPLPFRVLGAGVTMTLPQVDYDLEKQDTLKIGDQAVNRETVKVELLTVREFEGSGAYNDDAPEGPVLIVTYPEALVPANAEVEFITRAGQVLHAFSVTSEDIKSWKEKSKPWKLKKNFQFLRADFVRTAARVLEYQSAFRVCLGTSGEMSYTRLCTGEMEIAAGRAGAKRLSLLPVLARPARVIFQQDDVGLKAKVAVDPKSPVQFFAETAEGFTYEFGGYPEPLILTDFVETKSGQIQLVSESVKPTVPVIDVNPDQDGLVTRVFMWQQTIGDFRKYWRMNIAKEAPTVFMPAKGGGIYRYDFTLEKVPTEDQRLYIYKRSPLGTYANGPTIQGIVPAGVKLSSKELKVSVDKDGEFDWDVQALHRGEHNQSELLIDNKGKRYKAYYEIYKGFPREISARMSGLLGFEGKFILNGELAFNYWFEDIFGWPNYWLSRQRWGASAKAFQSLSEFKFGRSSGTMKSQTVDLKYRLSPGLWGRDESWGGLMSYDSFEYDIYKADKLGFGFFWARSMPKIFDELFNLLPFMRYPKWVDLEFVYYSMFLNSSVALPINPPEGQGNWALNFHGKVLWTKNFFGEAGFGIRQYDWTQTSGVLAGTNTPATQRFLFGLFYGTAGLGYSF